MSTIYMKIESLANSAAATIEILSFSFGVSRTTSSGSGAGAGKEGHSSITVIKRADTSSPVLFQAAGAGRSLGSGSVYFLPAVQSTFLQANAYLKYEFQDLFITGGEFTGSEQGDSLPVETFTAEFTTVEYSVYNPIITGTDSWQQP